jgi:hypothetical protein
VGHEQLRDVVVDRVQQASRSSGSGRLQVTVLEQD